MTTENNNGHTYVQAKAANESIKAQKARRQLKALDGQYIEREKVIRLVHQLASDSRRQWLSWAERVSPELSKKLGVDALLLQRLIQNGVEQQLDEFGDFEFTLRQDSMID